MKKNVLIVLIFLNTLLYSYNGYGQANKTYSNVETKNVLYYKVEEIVKMTFGGTTTRYTVSNLSLISKVNLGPDNIRIITPIYKDRNYKTKSYYVETRNLKKDSGKIQEPTNLIEIKIENSNIIIPENSKMEKISLALAIDKLTTPEKERNSKKNNYIADADNSTKFLAPKPKATNLVEAKTRNNENIKIAKSPKTDSFSLTISNLSTKVKGGDYKTKDFSPETEILTKKAEKTQKPANSIVSKDKSQKAKKTPVVLANTDSNKVESTILPITKTEPKKEEASNYVSINVTDVYERVAQKGYKSVYMFKELANHYFFRNQMEKAVKWYEELFAMNSKPEPIYYYRFGEALKKTGNIQKGNAMIEQFNKLVE